ncbi:uncharacterized protein LOC113779877 [Coffea eugenioides]|uniref:uncharacterized protein LOC113779877 n=2 Tax=Coffea eugenioides TaxID=49369 RepID=UPI000F6103B8|nr:uncharacterized protein LOC113779877 [Coffea eugenioides]
MAMQAGFGVSRILILVGAGYTGTVLLKNGKLSDVLTELQHLIKRYEKDGETEGDSDAMAVQIRRLAMEVRQLASARPITVLNGGSGQNALAALVPAAALGALGYGYMWWKGISFSDLMYVTKRNMAAAVENLTKHLEHVSDALAAAKKHLTQRIENLDGKLDEQVEMSKLIRSEVTDVRGDLSQINYDLDELQRMVAGLDGKLLSMEAKQELANTGVLYLCSVVNGKRVKMPDRLQDQLKVVGNSVPSLMGLKDVVDTVESANNNRLIIDGASRDGLDKLNDQKPRSLTRMGSIRC